MLKHYIQSEVFLREDIAAILDALDHAVTKLPLMEDNPLDMYVRGYRAALDDVRVATHNEVLNSLDVRIAEAFRLPGKGV